MNILCSPHYRPFSYREFYLARLEGNYADLGEEVQIEWYRTSGGKAKAEAAAAAVPSKNQNTHVLLA